MLARGFALNGDQERARRILADLRTRQSKRYVDSYYLALLLAETGTLEEALEELERAVEANSASLFLLEVDPSLDRLRDHPHFQTIRDLVFEQSVSTETNSSFAANECLR